MASATFARHVMRVMTHLHVCPATSPLRRSCRQSFLCLCLAKSSVATGCNWQHRNPTFATEDLYPTSGASCVSQGLEVLPCAILRQVSNPNPRLRNDHQHAEPHHPSGTLTASDRSTSWLAKALHFRINPQNKQETSRGSSEASSKPNPKKAQAAQTGHFRTILPRLRGPRRRPQPPLPKPFGNHIGGAQPHPQPLPLPVM